jgi:hypothetical protein
MNSQEKYTALVCNNFDKVVTAFTGENVNEVMTVARKHHYLFDTLVSQNCDLKIVKYILDIGGNFMEYSFSQVDHKLTKLLLEYFDRRKVVSTISFGIGIGGILTEADLKILEDHIKATNRCYNVLYINGLVSHGTGYPNYVSITHGSLDECYLPEY